MKNVEAGLLKLLKLKFKPKNIKFIKFIFNKKKTEFLVIIKNSMYGSLTGRNTFKSSGHKTFPHINLSKK